MIIQATKSNEQDSRATVFNALKGQMEHLFASSWMKQSQFGTYNYKSIYVEWFKI